MLRAFHPMQQLSFYYTNHHGKRELRNVTFMTLRHGANEYYPEPPQFFLHCMDHSRIEREPVERSFAVAKIEDLQLEWRMQEWRK